MEHPSAPILASADQEGAALVSGTSAFSSNVLRTTADGNTTIRATRAGASTESLLLTHCSALHGGLPQCGLVGWNTRVLPGAVSINGSNRPFNGFELREATGSGELTNVVLSKMDTTAGTLELMPLQLRANDDLSLVYALPTVVDSNYQSIPFGSTPQLLGLKRIPGFASQGDQVHPALIAFGNGYVANLASYQPRLAVSLDGGLNWLPAPAPLAASGLGPAYSSLDDVVQILGEYTNEQGQSFEHPITALLLKDNVGYFHLELLYGSGF